MTKGNVVSGVEGSIISQSINNNERENLLKKHLGLAEKIASKRSQMGFDYDDCYEAALFGLYKASRDYDPGKGVKFITLASKYIRTEIHDAVRKQKKYYEHHLPLDSSNDSNNSLSSDLSSEYTDISPSSSPVVNVQRRELIQVVKGSLKPQYWQIVSMSIEGYTSDETASRLSEKEATVRSQRNRAFLKLKGNSKVVDYNGGFAA
ncbi:sigma-70 family RNA polymerase sigma factor [Candidatus Poribacteria bacterium]|nr:sigma-70 family RNA polymerase sigma factor [Candidatus Poribacteria bacterium]